MTLISSKATTLKLETLIAPPGACSGEASNQKAVAFVNGVMHQATDPTLVFPMLFAAPAYQLGKATALRGLLAQNGASWVSRGLSLKALPAAAAFAAETVAFGLGSRALTHLAYGPVSWDLASVGTELAQAGMTLGFLKAAGFAGRKGMQWWRGLDEFSPQLWSRADHRAMFWTSQLSGYLGLVASHGLQGHGGNIWLDALGTHLALGIGGSAGRRLLGVRFQGLEHRLGSRAQQLYQQTKTNWNVFGLPSGSLPSAVAPGGALLTSQPVHPGWKDHLVQMAKHNGKERRPISSHPPSGLPSFSNSHLVDTARSLEELSSNLEDHHQRGDEIPNPLVPLEEIRLLTESLDLNEVTVIHDMVQQSLEARDRSEQGRQLLERIGAWLQARISLLGKGHGDAIVGLQMEDRVADAWQRVVEPYVNLSYPEGPSSSHYSEWEIAKPVPWVGDFQKEGDHFWTQGKLDEELVREYGEVTGTEVVTHSGYTPATLPFIAGFPAVFDVFLSSLMSNKNTSVIHARESALFHRPVRGDAEVKIVVTPKILGKPGKRQLGKIKVEVLDPQAPPGEQLLAEGNTTLLIQSSEGETQRPASGGTQAGVIPPDISPALVHKITNEDIVDYAAVSGDVNPIHMSDGAAQGRGLPGRIAHGMLIQGLAQRALFLADPQRDPSQPARFSTEFKEMVRPGEVLRFYVEPFEEKDGGEKGKAKITRAGTRVIVMNQSNRPVLEMVDETPGEQVRRVQDGEKVSYIYRKIEYKKGGPRVTYSEIPINAQAGIYRVKEIARRMEPEIEKLRDQPQAVDQPNVLVGVSSGYGLHDAVAAILSGGVKRGVGIFFENPLMVRVGNPLMIQALENVEGLRYLAENRQVDFPFFYASGILRQKDGTVRVISPAVTEAIKKQQAVAQVPDIHLLNAIAWSTHMGPLPGVKVSPYLPTLNMLKGGELEFVKVKEPDEGKGMDTLVSMGYTHRILLEGLEQFFGPKSLSLIATWAGGSQNIEVLRGIYGDGYLGKAKQIAEEGALDYHLKSREQDYRLGHHKVVRLPSFNSRALWGIPQGSIFGLLSQGVLQTFSTPEHPLNLDLTGLAPRVRQKIWSGVNVREHPLSQIEVDSAEYTFVGEINRRLDEIYRRIAEALPGYVQAYEEAYQTPWDGKSFDLKLLKEIPDFPERFREKNGYDFQMQTLPFGGGYKIFNLQTTRKILEGLVPENWQELIPAPEGTS